MSCAIPGLAALASSSLARRRQSACGSSPAQVQFTDRIQGTYRQNVADAVGDFILKRRDQIYAYVLAVAVDDAAQGITHIVRGADLLDNTPRQIYLQRLLGLAEPDYAHVPVLTESDGGKLAKSRRSVRLSADSPLPQLIYVFSLLGLAPPPSLVSATICRCVALGHRAMERREGAKTSRFARKRLIILEKKCRFALALHCAIL